MQRVSEALNAWLVPLYGDALKLHFDLDEVSALALRRERVWQRLAGADWLTRDEKRAATGYAPIGGAARPGEAAGEAASA